VGPGSYNADKLSLARAAGARFAASQRFERAPAERSSPGPGAYETSTGGAAKGHRFPNHQSRASYLAQSADTKGVATPGPAAYDTIHAAQSTKKRMPGFSMPGRYKEASETSPGPSDYGYYTTFR